MGRFRIWGSGFAVGKSGFDSIAGLQGTQNSECSNGFAAQIGSDVQSDDGQPQHANVKHVARSQHRRKFGRSDVADAKIDTFAGDDFADRVGVRLYLVADCGADEIGPIGIESLLHKKFDLAKINEAKVDRDLFGIWLFGKRGHRFACLPSKWMVN